MALFQGTIDQIENNTYKINKIEKSDDDGKQKQYSDDNYPTVNAVIEYVDGELKTKADKSYVDGEITASEATIEEKLNTKADKSYVDGEIDKKADKDYVDNLSIKKKVVSELPTENIKANVIYLVPKENATDDDKYDEYIFIPDSEGI